MSQGFYTGKAVGAAEKAWAERNQQPTYHLMQRAVEAALGLIVQRVERTRPVVILCGRGNNGGDGRLLAARLAALGWSVQVWSAGAPRAGSDAEQAHTEMTAAGVPVTDDLAALAGGQVIYVDAILGTGFTGEPHGQERAAIEFLQQQPRSTIIAVDCPSGLDASTGAAECAVAAGHTLTFIAGKVGLVTGHGPGLTGVLHYADLGVAVPEADAVAQSLDRHTLQWPQRLADAHKGSCGHVRIIGGSTGMVGAGIMAAESALVCGSGMVTAHIDASGFTPLLTRSPEVMTSEDAVPEPLGPRDVLAVGPGLGRDAVASERWEQLLHKYHRAGNSWVVDADALWHLAKTPQQHDRWVLTPHPGEAARLLGCTVADVQSDRLRAAREVQRRFGGVVILKGAGNLVATSGRVAILAESQGAMATGGLGDVLTGVIAALLAQGLTPAQAAGSGLTAVVTAAGILARHQPVVRATNVLAQLPATLHDLGFAADSQTWPGLSLRVT